MSKVVAKETKETDPTLSHLNDVHKEQILNYLKYFRAKRNEHLDELNGIVEDAKEMRLFDDMYTKDDVLNILEGIRTLIQDSSRTEMEKISLQSVLFLHKLFLQAEGHGATLTIDTQILDDEVLLSGIGKLDISEKKETSTASTSSLSLIPSKKLTALSNGVVDIKLVTKIKDLELLNEGIKSRFNKLQEQCKAAMREKTQLEEKNSELTSALNAAKNTNTNNAQVNVDTNKSYEEKIQKLQKELKASQSELQGKISQASQFKSLQKMVMAKNKQLRDVRSRLKKYEPETEENVKDDDKIDVE